MRTHTALAKLCELRAEDVRLDLDVSLLHVLCLLLLLLLVIGSCGHAVAIAVPLVGVHLMLYIWHNWHKIAAANAALLLLCCLLLLREDHGRHKDS